MSDITKDLLHKIEQQIFAIDLSQSFSKKGEIIEIKDGVALVSGLEWAMYSEIILFENGMKWLVFDLMQDYAWILILGEYSSLKQGQSVTATGKMFSVGVGPAYLGRVLDGLGDPIDEVGDVKPKELYPVEKVAPGVITREAVGVPLQTGIKAIDAMVPVGRGQRELIIGDRQTGKTTVAIDTIINQRDQNVKCIYVAIGQKESKVARIVQSLREKGALEYTIVISAPANSSAVSQYMAPYVGCTMGEWFMNNGQDALIIYDDLSKHAVAYREMSLLLRRPPGREAYPWDVFYIHSRLLERAANLNNDFGGGSLTALPIVETQSGDVSAYIPTNVISITDWQIYLEADLFNAGVRPAVNVWLSVSRVWWAAQTGLVKKVSGKLKLELAAYRELESFAQFWSDLDEVTQSKISRWVRMVEMLKQPENSPIHFYKQAVLIYAGVNGYLDRLEVSQIKQFEQTLYDKLDSVYSSESELMKKEKKLTEEIEVHIKRIMEETLAEIQ